MSLATTKLAMRWTHINVLPSSTLPTPISRPGSSCCGTATPMVSHLRRPCRQTCTLKHTRTRTLLDLQVPSGLARHRLNLSRQTHQRRLFLDLAAGEGSLISTRHRSRQTLMPRLSVTPLEGNRLPLRVNPARVSRSRCGRSGSLIGRSRFAGDLPLLLTMAVLPKCSSRNRLKVLRLRSRVNASLTPTMAALLRLPVRSHKDQE